MNKGSALVTLERLVDHLVESQGLGVELKGNEVYEWYGDTVKRVVDHCNKNGYILRLEKNKIVLDPNRLNVVNKKYTNVYINVITGGESVNALHVCEGARNVQILFSDERGNYSEDKMKDIVQALFGSSVFNAVSKFAGRGVAIVLSRES